MMPKLRTHIEIRDGRKYKVYDDLNAAIDLTPPDPNRFYKPMNPVYPDKSYKLKSSKADISFRLQQEGHDPESADLFAESILDGLRTELYQNVDEWAQGKPLSDVLLGHRKLTLNGLIYRWKRETGHTPGMEYFIPRLNKYLNTGRDFMDMYPTSA